MFKVGKKLLIFSIGVLVLSIIVWLGSIENKNSKSIESQLKGITENFSEIIQEEDTKYGKLVFFSLKSKDDSGVGLAIFNKDEDEWIRSKSTYHLIGDNAYSTGYIKINEKEKVIYGYGNLVPIQGIKRIPENKLNNNSLEVNDSYISYTIVAPERKLKLDTH